MIFPRDEHIRFYKEEIRALEEEIKSYWLSNVMELYKANRLHIGIFEGVDRNGFVILRHKKGKAPRLKQIFFGFTLKSSVPAFTEWNNFRYMDIRKRKKFHSDVFPVFFHDRGDEEYSHVHYKGFDIKMIESCKVGDTPVLLGEKEPPFEYLLNLKKIVSDSSEISVSGKVLFLDALNNSWNPIHLYEKDKPVDLIKRKLGKHNELVIQGPPGTGKTYLMSELCASLLEEGKSVLVTANSNRALTELAEKPQLKKWLKAGRVLKTNLSTDEAQKVHGLRYAEDIRPISGHLTLATYYQLGKQAALGEDVPVFDLLIIEEASQAFLATIAAFKPMGKKMILIGDHKQLPPITVQKDSKKIHPDIEVIIHGLETYANNVDLPAYRKVETYRLNKRATLYTGIFYDESLVSVSPDPVPPQIDTAYSELFMPEGGPNIVFKDISGEGKGPQSVSGWLKDVIVDLIEKNKQIEISVLSPFVVTTKMLQAEIYPATGNYQNITVETIDRIQGMSCDITFFVIPFGSTFFSYNLNRFNVATSRSKMHTVIITDKHFLKHNPSSGQVASFWGRLIDEVLNVSNQVKS